ncbi:MAG: DUF21 domain-containing protein, partial [Bacilli bacterium]|nr:DUF21 domain-containing protein [Bacilli bacterium]
MRTGLVITLFIVIAVLIFLSGMFSASDMVYLTVNQLRLKKDVEKGKKTAKVALNFAENYDTTLTTVLFSNNLVNIAASSLSTVLALELGKAYLNVETWTTIFTISLLLLILIFGEILPKVIGRAFSYKLSTFLAPIILVLKYLFFPFVFISSMIGKFFAWPFTRKASFEETTDEELQEIVETIEDEGVIDEDQGELIQNVILFKDTDAHEIMTPRIDMVALDIEDGIRGLMSLKG